MSYGDTITLDFSDDQTKEFVIDRINGPVNYSSTFRGREFYDTADIVMSIRHNKQLSSDKSILPDMVTTTIDMEYKLDADETPDQRSARKLKLMWTHSHGTDGGEFIQALAGFLTNAAFRAKLVNYES